MQPLNDIEAERMLEDGEYIWTDRHKGYMRARRKGQSLADYRRSEPDIISLEELDDNGFTDPRAMRKDALRMARRKDQTRQLNRSDYSIESVFVPDEMTFPLMDLMLRNAVTGGAALRLGAPALVTPFHLGIALGMARRALDEITEQAVEKGRGLPPSPLPTHPHFQFALGKAELELASARALALQVVSDVWADARAGRVPPPEKQAEARAASAYVTEVAQRVATSSVRLLRVTDSTSKRGCFRGAGHYRRLTVMLRREGGSEL